MRVFKKKSKIDLGTAKKYIFQSVKGHPLSAMKTGMSPCTLSFAVRWCKLRIYPLYNPPEVL